MLKILWWQATKKRLLLELIQLRKGRENLENFLKSKDLMCREYKNKILPDHNQSPESA